MPSTYSSSLRIELVADNEQAGIWGQTTNRNFTQVFEEAMTQTAEVDVTAGDVTLTAVNGATDQARRPFIRVIGTPVVARQVNVPDVTKLYIVQNTTGQNLTVKPSGQTGVTLLAGQVGYVRCRQGLSAQVIEFLSTTNGNLVVPGTLTVNGATTLNGATQINNTLGVTGAATFGSTTVHTGIATFNGAANFNNLATITAGSNQLTVRSTGAGVPTILDIGRTGPEAYWGVSAGANNLTTGDVAGDTTLRAAQRLWLTVGTGGYMRMDGGVGIRALTGLLAAGELINPVVSGVNLGLSGGQPSQSFYYTGGGADSKHWNNYADATQLNYRIINDAGNAQALWLTVARTGMVVSRVHFPGSTTGNSRMLIGDYSGSLVPRLTVGASMAAGGADGINIVKADDSASVQLLLTGSGYSYAGVGANQAWLYTRAAMDVNIGPDGNAAVALVANGARQLITNSTGTGLGVSPTCKLDVFGNFFLVRDANYKAYFGRASDLVVGGTTSQVGVRAENGDILFTTVIAGNEFMRLDTAGRLSGKTWHNNASGLAGTTQQFIGSGTYTPTTIGSSNATGITHSVAQYTRVGNVVHVTGRVQATASGAVGVVITISLPIASAFTTTAEAFGAASVFIGTGSPAATVSSTSGPSGLSMNFNAPSGVAFSMTYSIQYVVV